jgi:hypothetical protein
VLALSPAPPPFPSRSIARYTYAFETSEPYDPLIHDEEFRFPTNSGEFRCRHVLRPLIEKGQSVSVDEPFVSGTLSPIDSSQLWLSLNIYRTDKQVTKLTTRGRRTLVVPVGSPKAGQHVTERDKVAMVRIKVGDERDGRSMDERTCKLYLYFGRTEITAHAVADVTGDSQYAAIKYDA